VSDSLPLPRQTEIHCEDHGAVWLITISNPTRRNAFTHDMTQSLMERLRGAESAKKVRCVIITGEGDTAFSSGHDLTENEWQQTPSTSPVDINAAFSFPAEMTTPTIAAVNGYAYAAGLILALSCDLRVVSSNAAFCASGARMGLLPVAGQISRLPYLVPFSRALELLITGTPMKADEAYALGFASRLVPQGDAVSEALKIAKTIADNSPTVIREIKRGMKVGISSGYEAARAFELKTGATLKGGPDHREGVRAFLEKRPPTFPDRDDG
jgi:enoyl-CoA hydratase/carnithine racemase